MCKIFTDGPDVDTGPVLSVADQQFRRSVPPSRHIVGVILSRIFAIKSNSFCKKINEYVEFDFILLRSRANPKSQSFTTPSLVRRMFSGLTSRWMQLWAWQYPTACNVCQMIRFVNTSGTLQSSNRRLFSMLDTTI